MRPRQTLLDLFSSFLQFEAERARGWISDPRLRRSMQQALQQQPADAQTSEQFWVLYWYKVWEGQLSNLARDHLGAYLQEACYWAAQKAAAQLATPQYGLTDYFQIAIAQVNKVLKGFNPQQGFSLKNYASVTFSSVIKDLLRQRQAVDRCTHWALLRKLSQKRLVEALQNQGLSPEIDRYVLAWQCFKSLYVPVQATATSKLPRPDPDTWEAIAQLYNQERLSQLIVPGPSQSPEVLEQWLLSSAKAARLYLYPAIVSLNAPKPGWESGEFQDDLIAGELPLPALIAQEEDQSRQAQQRQLRHVLVKALSQLDPPAQEMLHLYYGEGNTQQQIAQQLDIKQYTVSRRLTKARERLLLALAQWSQESLHTSLNSNLLNQMSAVLDEWLAEHFSPTPASTE